MVSNMVIPWSQIQLFDTAVVQAPNKPNRLSQNVLSAAKILFKDRNHGDANYDYDHMFDELLYASNISDYGSLKYLDEICRWNFIDDDDEEYARDMINLVLKCIDDALKIEKAEYERLYTLCK